MVEGRRPRVVIIGGGFGGLHAARSLARAAVDVTVVDRTNHHLFQPLLYQVATATLAATDVVAPIRMLLRRQRNARVLFGEVQAIDTARRIIRLDAGDEIAYDYLIVAAGARHSYFGRAEWEPFAPGLKSVEDALEIRSRFLLAFEEAERATDPATRREYLTFVIVGGGPTGVELAGMIPTFARHVLPREFRSIRSETARVVLVEALPRILTGFPDRLAARAQRDLEDLGVEVRVGTAVTNVTSRFVEAGGERIAARAIFWAAGNEASPLGRMLGAPCDRAGRVIVEPDLSVPGLPEVYVAGDLAALTANGEPVPAVAPAAMQSGHLAALNVLRAIQGERRETFRYRDKGSLATIGRHRAVCQLGSVELTGRLAWWFWLFVHILYLAGFRNRVSVLIEWAYSYFTYGRGARLLIGRRRRES